MYKILAYISGQYGHVFFSSLKILQDKIPLEVFLIIDRSVDSKMFYENQKFLKIKKKWYYRDNIKKNHEPDIQYLKKFENKYSIKLWELIIADPSFYSFDGKSKFLENEILSLVEDDCKFLESVIDEVNPDFVITQAGGQKQLNILREISKSKNHKTLYFASAKFGMRNQISEEYDMIDNVAHNVNILEETQFSKEDIKKIRTDLDLYEHYKSKNPGGYNLSKWSFFLGNLLKIFTIQKESKKQDPNFKQFSIFGQYFEMIVKNIQKISRRKFLDNNSIKNTITNEKFVLFTLHMQPEMTTSILSPYYTDQLALIENIARSLPINYFLYVKEHSTMGKFLYWRNTNFYKKILNMPNVRLISPFLDSADLIKKSKLVITINGSISYEAALQNKSVIVFGDVSNMKLPSVKKINNLEEMPKILREMLESPFDSRGCKEFFELKFKETMNIKMSMFSDIFNLFYHKNTSIDNITNEKMKVFLEKNEKDLNMISDEFIRKFKQFEN